VAAAVALTSLAALVASGLGQGLCLLFQQFIQRFLHAAADQFFELSLDNFLIQLYNFLRHSLLSPFRMVCRDFILPEPASYVFFYALFNLRKLLNFITPQGHYRYGTNKNVASENFRKPHLILFILLSFNTAIA
jgi:hypothetical protein